MRRTNWHVMRRNFWNVVFNEHQTRRGVTGCTGNSKNISVASWAHVSRSHAPPLSTIRPLLFFLLFDVHKSLYPLQLIGWGRAAVFVSHWHFFPIAHGRLPDWEEMGAEFEIMCINKSVPPLTSNINSIFNLAAKLLQNGYSENDCDVLN